MLRVTALATGGPSGALARSLMLASTRRESGHLGSASETAAMPLKQTRRTIASSLAVLGLGKVTILHAAALHARAANGGAASLSLFPKRRRRGPAARTNALPTRARAFVPRVRQRLTANDAQS